MAIEISDEELRELRKQGHKVKTKEGKPYFPRRERPAVKESATVQTAPEPKEDNFQKEAISAILTVAQTSEANMSAVIANQSAIVEAIREIVKPKPKKRYYTQVLRKKDSEIYAFDTKEM